MDILNINSSNQQTISDSGIEAPQLSDNTIILLGKFTVEADYFDIVESNFNDIHPFLLGGVNYTAEDLVGAELWADLTGFTQRHAHLCLKHIASLPGSRLTDMSSVHCGATSFQIVNE